MVEVPNETYQVDERGFDKLILARSTDETVLPS